MTDRGAPNEQQEDDEAGAKQDQLAAPVPTRLAKTVLMGTPVPIRLPETLLRPLPPSFGIPRDAAAGHGMALQAGMHSIRGLSQTLRDPGRLVQPGR